jgi:Fe-Mn family superoxide dismutase
VTYAYERWHAEFTAIGKALGGGSGWVLLSWSRRDRKLVNQWTADHCHALAGGTPLLALDMHEHSYHVDFGAKAPATSTPSWAQSAGATPNACLAR